MGPEYIIPVPHLLRPLFAAPAAPYFHLRRGFLISWTRGTRMPSEGRGAPLQRRPARLGKGLQNLGAQADTSSRNRAGYSTAYNMQGKVTRITTCGARV